MPVFIFLQQSASQVKIWWFIKRHALHIIFQNSKKLIKLFLKSRPFCSDTYLAIMEKHICMMADLHVRAHFIYEHILHSIKLQAQQIIIKNKNKNKTLVEFFFFSSLFYFYWGKALWWKVNYFVGTYVSVSLQL